MTTRGVSRFALFNKLPCEGGALLSTGAFVTASSAVTQRSLEQVESVTLTMPRTAASADVVREGQILQRWRSDSLVSEWPIGPITIATGDDATVTIVARALKYRLGECGLVTQPGVTPADSLPILTFTATGTPTELVQQFLTARSPSDALASRLSWVSDGTIDPTAVVTLSVDWWTPQQFLDGIIDALEAVNVFAEWDIRKNGTTNYLIDVLNTPLAT